MIIDAVDLYRVRLPLVYPFRTAFGDYGEIESVLVRLTSGGHSGWGETAPWQAPAYSPEWAAGVVLLLRDWLAPRLLGRDITSGQQLQAALSLIKGNPFAKAGLDLAWWDLHARQAGRPLWQVLGGQSDLVAVGADFGVMDSLDQLLEAIASAVQAGFQRVKLKVRPGWELDMLRALDDYDLAMIEQPLAHDDLHDHARLQRALRTPVCLDESITSPAKAAQAVELGACRWINIKPGRVGGLTPAVEIHNLCQAAGVPVWIGGMLESAVGAAHCTALATLPNVAYPSDIFPSSRFFETDLAAPEVTLAGPGQVRATALPGIGCEPRPELLAALQVETVTLNRAGR